MEAKDKSILQQIQERYPGTDPDIDVDWEIGEIFFNAGEKQGISKGIKEVMEWGETICMEHGMRKRRKCDKCWQAYKKSKGIG